MDTITRGIGSAKAGEAWLIAVQRYGGQFTLAQLLEIGDDLNRKRPRESFYEVSIMQPDDLIQTDTGGYTLMPSLELQKIKSEMSLHYF